MAEDGKISVLLTVIIGTLSVGLLASLFLNYAIYKSAQDEKRLTQGELTDLRYQVKQDQLAMASPTAQPSASPTPAAASPSPAPSATPAAPAVLGVQSLVMIPELGVKLTPSAPLADLSYVSIPSQTVGAIVVGFKSDSFSAKYPSCTPGSALGQLVKRPATQKAPASNKFISTVGGYKFYYYNPGNTCATSAAGKADVAAATAALTNTILKTIAQ